MYQIRSYVKKFFLSILVLSMFNLMAVGLNVNIPLSIINTGIITVFDIHGFVVLIVFYMFILWLWGLNVRKI